MKSFETGRRTVEGNIHNTEAGNKKLFGPKRERNKATICRVTFVLDEKEIIETNRETSIDTGNVQSQSGI